MKGYNTEFSYMGYDPNIKGYREFETEAEYRQWYKEEYYGI